MGRRQQVADPGVGLGPAGGDGQGPVGVADHRQGDARHGVERGRS